MKNLREGNVAQQHFEAEDDGKREHLLRNLPIEFKKAASSNPSRAVGQPLGNPQSCRLRLGWVPERGAGRSHGEIRRNCGSQT